MTEFGRCLRLLGSVQLIADELHEKLLAQKLDVVVATSLYFDYASVVIVDTVQKLWTISPSIHSGMSVIVCDSIVALHKVANLQPYDYEGTLTDFKVIEPRKLSSYVELPTKIIAKEVPLLPVIVDNYASKGFLTLYNKISSELNHSARLKFNQLLIKSVEYPMYRNTLLSWIYNIDKNNGSLFEKTLTQEKLMLLSKAIKDYHKGGNLAELSSSLGVDSYEITFLSKLLRKQHEQVKSRTKRAKS